MTSLKELAQTFAAFDRDGDGRITCSELRHVMQSLRQAACSADQIRAMIKHVDADEFPADRLTFEQLVDMLDSLSRMREAQGRLESAFNELDRDGDGHVSAADLRDACSALGGSSSVSGSAVGGEIAALRLVSAADRNRDGKINYEEFLSAIRARMFEESDSSDSARETCTTYSTAPPAHLHMDETEKPSKDKYLEIQLMFSLFDKDRDGFISQQEVRTVFNALGRHISEKQLNSIFNRVDLDGNGLIDLVEFARMMEFRQAKKSADGELRELFAAFDRDRNGYIDGNELKVTMRDLGLDLSESDLADMMNEVGVGPKGRIYYEDFVRMMTGKIGKAQKKVSNMYVDISPSKPGRTLSIVDEEEEEDPATSELRVAFAMFDKDADGAISVSELHDVMQSIGFDVTHDQVQKLIKQVDLDGNGTIEFEELSCLMQTYKKSLGQQDLDRLHDDEMRHSFKVFDRDSNGYIDSEELRLTMLDLGVDLSKQDVAAMMKEAKVTDGRIYYEEFVRVVFSQFMKPISPAGNYGNEQLQELKIAFSMFDKDGDGAITSRELDSVLNTLGIPPKHAAARRMIDKFDYDGNGTLEFDEFVRMMTDKDDEGQTRWSRTENLKQKIPETWTAFKVFDRDHNGYIDKTELRMTMRELGVDLSPSDLDSMMKEADTDGDGRINYQEFVIMFKNNFGATHPPQSPSSSVHSNQTSTPSTNGTHVINDVSAPSPASSPSHHPYSSCSALQSSAPPRTAVPPSSHHVTATANGSSRVSTCSPDSSPPPPAKPASTGKSTTLNNNNNNSRKAEKSRSRLSRLTARGGSSKSRNPGQGVKGSTSSPCLSDSSPNPADPTDRDSYSFEDYREAFKMFDKDCDGCITAEELEEVVRTLGMPFNTGSIENMIRRADIDGNGTVDFNEFLRMMSNSRVRTGRSEEARRASEQEESRQAFSVFDIDGDGYIDADELKRTMANLGEPLSDQDVAAMIRAADIDGDQRINYQEFIQMMYNKSK